MAVLITVPVGSMDAVIAWSLKPFMDVVLVEKQSGWTMYIPLMIVVPPVTEEYLSHIPPQINLFEKLEVLMDPYQGKVLYLNCYRDKDFTNEDFADCDHLNQRGAEKLTAKIKQKFQERE